MTGLGQESSEKPRRIGIVGYGKLGQNLCSAINEHPSLELAFVWNRSDGALLQAGIPEHLRISDLEDCAKTSPDLIVEVAHPSITQQYGAHFLSVCDFMMGSPTALADQQLEASLKAASERFGHGLFVPSGALWGGEDIRRMADRNTLTALTVTMRKHPASFKLEGSLKALNEAAMKSKEEMVLFEGSVRDLCPLAPNNVNTMAAAAVAAHNLGFGRVKGRLVADPNLPHWHYVEVVAEGPIVDGNRFRVETIRKNPADLGAVTGSATFSSFLSSILQTSKNKGIAGVHLC